MGKIDRNILREIALIGFKHFDNFTEEIKKYNVKGFIDYTVDLEDEDGNENQTKGFGVI